MTHALYGRTTHIAARGWISAATRRVVLGCLILGWAAFWLVATLQPCCRLATAQSPAAIASAAHDHYGHPTEHPADACGSITVVAHASLIATAPPTGADETSQTMWANALPPRLIAPRANRAYLAPLPLPPPRAVAAFHQRTSRIQI